MRISTPRSTLLLGGVFACIASAPLIGARPPCLYAELVQKHARDPQVIESIDAGLRVALATPGSSPSEAKVVRARNQILIYLGKLEKQEIAARFLNEVADWPMRQREKMLDAVLDAEEDGSDARDLCLFLAKEFKRNPVFLRFEDLMVRPVLSPNAPEVIQSAIEILDTPIQPTGADPMLAAAPNYRDDAMRLLGDSDSTDGRINRHLLEIEKSVRVEREAGGKIKPQDFSRNWVSAIALLKRGVAVSNDSIIARLSASPLRASPELVAELARAYHRNRLKTPQSVKNFDPVIEFLRSLKTEWDGEKGAMPPWPQYFLENELALSGAIPPDPRAPTKEDAVAYDEFLKALANMW